MIINDLSFLLRVVNEFQNADLSTWVFGGWAEELHGLRDAGSHCDIDLLYPAQNFEKLDSYIEDIQIQEIPQKRFSHKRAVEYDGVRIEFLLLEPQENVHVTHFFDGRFVYQWPVNTLRSPTVLAKGKHLQIASPTALFAYRSNYPKIIAALRQYEQELELKKDMQIP